MFRQLTFSITSRLTLAQLSLPSYCSSLAAAEQKIAYFSSTANRRERQKNAIADEEMSKRQAGVDPKDMPFLHFRRTISQQEQPNRQKFKIPRKRASKLFHQINTELVQDNVEQKPAVLQVPFRVGDAIEVTQVASGGVHSTEMETVRGVVLGIRRRGLGSAIYIRDVLMGEPMERHIPFHSPLVKSIKVLQKNFVKGKEGKKIKRAKLYYLRKRNPALCRVTREK